MANALQSHRLLSSRNIEELSKVTTCDPNSKACAYGECRECLPDDENSWAREHFFISVDDREDHEEWQNINNHSKKGNDKSKGWAKHTITGHVFNINYRELRRNLKQNECLLHVDFSENYSCKYSKKKSRWCILVAHISRLHTGVLYTQGEQVPHSFCSISPSRRHDPVAIWAHLIWFWR